MLNLPSITDQFFAGGHKIDTNNIPIKPVETKIDNMPTATCLEDVISTGNAFRYLNTQKITNKFTRQYQKDVSLLNSDVWSVKNDDDEMSEKDYISDSESSFEPLNFTQRPSK